MVMVYLEMCIVAKIVMKLCVLLIEESHVGMDLKNIPVSNAFHMQWRKKIKADFCHHGSLRHSEHSTQPY